MVDVDLLVEALLVLGGEIAEPLACTHQSRQFYQAAMSEDIVHEAVGEVQEREHGGGIAVAL